MFTGLVEEKGAVTAIEELGDSVRITIRGPLVTSDAQLLRIPASTVRPQGRAAGGMAGIKLGRGAEVVSFNVVVPDDSAVVLTVAGSGAALPGTDAGDGEDHLSLIHI